MRAPVPEVARAWAALGLRLPPIPVELADRLDGGGEPLALASADVDPWDRAAFLAAAGDPAHEGWVSFGGGGYGAGNRALFYQLVTGAVAVFARMPFGNVLVDPEAERTGALAVLERIEALVPAAEAAVRAGRRPADRRLVVIHDPCAGSRLGLLPGPLRRHPDALAGALEAHAPDDEPRPIRGSSRVTPTTEVGAWR